MPAKDLDVAIIGAGTAGLSARSEVARVTDNYLVFDPGPLGTLCARTACMPSKALLQSAHDFHRRHDFDRLGIDGSDALRVDGARVLAETRKLRDTLVSGVLESMADWRASHLVNTAARFDAHGVLHADDRQFRPRATVIATGAQPIVPPEWRDKFTTRLRTSDDIFELATLPRRMAVIGLGPVGLELGQAFARLGVSVTGFDPSETIGGLQDPVLQPRLARALAPEMTIIHAEAEPVEGPDGAVTMTWDGGRVDVDCVLVAMGRAPDHAASGIDALGAVPHDSAARFHCVDLDQRQMGLYLAGDAGPGPALLHEATDEGRIAGYHAARATAPDCRRRTPLGIVFCQPQIALAGETWGDLADRRDTLAIGEACFDGSGRTLVSREAGGAIRLYAERASARLLGAAILGPDAEHLAHLLAFAIGQKVGLEDLLQMPAYHPTHEEVLRGAVRSALRVCDTDPPDLELKRG